MCWAWLVGRLIGWLATIRMGERLVCKLLRLLSTFSLINYLTSNQFRFDNDHLTDKSRRRLRFASVSHMGMRHETVQLLRFVRFPAINNRQFWRCFKNKEIGKVFDKIVNAYDSRHLAWLMKFMKGILWKSIKIGIIFKTWIKIDEIGVIWMHSMWWPNGWLPGNTHVWAIDRFCISHNNNNNEISRETTASNWLMSEWQMSHKRWCYLAHLCRPACWFVKPWQYACLATIDNPLRRNSYARTVHRLCPMRIIHIHQTV